MAKVICIMGESGSGKTTAMRNLNPSETFYIDCDGKGLSWKGWRSQYNKANKNYVRTSNTEKIRSALKRINETQTLFKYVVIDTLNGIMIDDEMRRIKEKGYDKWQDLAQSVYGLIVYANACRDDLTIIFTAHTQTDMDDSGYMFTRIKTNGKKLNKICLESKFTTVLLSKKSGNRYILETQANNSTAKSPMGAFESFEIDNDIVQVVKALEEY
ncbi:MAG: ATP-binding protein [Clostridia bacterium]|jgi:hypothetical protein|nr:ATP-binding protein [Clostridia bacterium]MCI2014040.1 ATP-binding protein [Clostridia bacterium]